MNIIKNNYSASYVIEESTELLPFLFETNNEKSRNAVKTMLKRGQVLVDSRRITQHDQPLFPGQRVDILTNTAVKKFTSLVGISILYEDEAIIVINKDAGILSIASRKSNELDAYRQLTEYVKYDHRKNRVYILHKTGREISGVMIYAKTEAAKNKLQDNWQDMIKKQMYTALVEGYVENEQETISSWLNETQNLQVYSSQDDDVGKHAVTHYTKIDGNENYSLLEVEAETERRNQIRVHMQDLGHPVVGDKKYGSKRNPIERLALHATTLEFMHPSTEELMTYTVNAPISFSSQLR